MLKVLSHSSAAIGDHAAAAADAGVVEQQMDLVGVVAVGDLVAKPLDLRLVRHVGDVRRDAQPLRQSRRLAQPLRFRHARRRNVAHCDVAGLRHQLANQLAPHARAAAGDYGDPPSKIVHPYLPLSGGDLKSRPESAGQCVWANLS